MTTNKDVLSEYDFHVVLDASGSMAETDMPGGKSRWNAMQESVLAFTREIEAIDTDGIGIVVFSSAGISEDAAANADKVKDIFANRSPRGGTPMAEALRRAVAMAGRSPKKDFVLVITDGVPDEPARVIDVIKEAAAKQETDDSLTICFVQVGHDSSATKYLQGLDDSIKGIKFDIVDAITFEEAEKFPTIADLVIKAIND